MSTTPDPASETPGVRARRRLGQARQAVSRIGLGLAALGRPGYINVGHGEDLAGATDEPAMEQRAHAVFDAAYAAGIRYFDAARSYGKAEAFLGSWLRNRGVASADVVVGSKWGYTYTAEWRVDADVHEVKDLSVATLRRQLAETREALGPRLDVYQIHSATVESGVFDDADLLGLLSELRQSGLTIGLTATGPNQAHTIERAIACGVFEVVQATWNLLEQAAGAALSAAHDAGLVVIVKEALANGRLTARGDVGPLIAAADRARSTPDALALAVVLAQPWADVVLSGASSVQMLESNVAASEAQLDDQLLGELTALRERPDRYWETRAALPWN